MGQRRRRRRRRRRRGGANGKAHDCCCGHGCLLAFFLSFCPEKQHNEELCTVLYLLCHCCLLMESFLFLLTSAKAVLANGGRAVRTGERRGGTKNKRSFASADASHSQELKFSFLDFWRSACVQRAKFVARRNLARFYLVVREKRKKNFFRRQLEAQNSIRGHYHKPKSNNMGMCIAKPILDPIVHLKSIEARNIGLTWCFARSDARNPQSQSISA